mgnify:CR=1 FL=1
MKDDKWAQKNSEKLTEKARKKSSKELDRYGKELLRDPNSVKTNGKLSSATITAYSQKMAELMTQKVSGVRAPSGRVVKFVAKRGEVGVMMALADEGYNMEQLSKGVWASGRVAYKKTVLDIEDDAARANWGGNWRMPTAEEWNELVSYTTMTSVTDSKGNAIYHTFTANDGSGNYIIVPATGPWYDNEDPYRTEDNPQGGSQTWYWLPDLSGANATTPYVECIHVGGDRHQKTSPLRYYGLPIRAVRTR